MYWPSRDGHCDCSWPQVPGCKCTWTWETLVECRRGGPGRAVASPWPWGIRWEAGQSPPQRPHASVYSLSSCPLRALHGTHLPALSLFPSTLVASWLSWGPQAHSCPDLYSSYSHVASTQMSWLGGHPLPWPTSSPAILSPAALMAFSFPRAVVACRYFVFILPHSGSPEHQLLRGQELGSVASLQFLP
jgi:hypothetical protein